MYNVVREFYTALATGIAYYIHHAPAIIHVLGSLKLTPHYGNQLGGAPILVSGNNVTFREEDDITCVFGDREVKGVYVDKDQALCVSPELSQTGIVLFQLLIARDDPGPFRGEANYNSCRSMNCIS